MVLCEFSGNKYKEVKECVLLIKQNKGIDIDIDHIPHDDAETLRLCQDGQATDTFAMVAYQIAYLKVHYPEEYMTIVLKSRWQDELEALRIMRECKVQGIKVSSQGIDIENAHREYVKNNRCKYKIKYGILSTENGDYLATTVDEQQLYDYYIVDRDSRTTAKEYVDDLDSYEDTYIIASKEHVNILDSYLVDPLEANGWTYDATADREKGNIFRSIYQINIKKNGDEISFEVTEDSGKNSNLDSHSFFSSIMVKIANQCESADDVDRLLTDYKLPIGSFKQPIEWYMHEAEVGNIDVLTELAEMYSKGYGVKKDPGKSLEWLSKAAEAGSTESQKRLGDSYAKGAIVERDIQQAMKWYTKAAESGDTDAMLELAELHSQMSVSWYRKAADSGSQEAQKKLAEHFYKSGKFAKAGTLYKKLNEHGLFNNIVGHCYYELKCYSEAVKYYNIGAQQKDADALIALGKCYYLGHGVPKDRAKANMYFMAAIEAKKANEDLPF